MYFDNDFMLYSISKSAIIAVNLIVMRYSPPPLFFPFNFYCIFINKWMQIWRKSFRGCDIPQQQLGLYLCLHLHFEDFKSKSNTQKKLQTKRYLNLKHFEREYKVNFDWTQPSRQSKEFSQLFLSPKMNVFEQEEFVKM